MTTSEAIQKVIDIAKAEVGYLEKKSDANLDDKTANAGSANYTKYWRDVYPAYQGQAWCACFVTWLFKQAFGEEKARKLLGHYPYVYCPTLAGKTSNYTAHKGDVIIFYNGSTYSHTGYVIDVTDTTIYTIEGNTSGASGIVANGGGVKAKSYTRGTLHVKTKFYQPDYSLVADGSETETTANASDQTDYTGSYHALTALYVHETASKAVSTVNDILSYGDVFTCDGTYQVVDGSTMLHGTVKKTGKVGWASLKNSSQTFLKKY